MLFNSYDFIFFLLPIVIVLYFVLNRIGQLFGKIILIVSSVFFFSYDRPKMMVYLALSIFINYVCVRMFNKWLNYKKAFMLIPLVINVGLLLYFKYYNFAIQNVNAIFETNFAAKSIVLPLGISFYTFQQIAYIVAIEREEIESNNLIDYLAYILFFPKLLMGPLMDPVDFINQINQDDRKKFNIENFVIGIKIFSLGILKKALIADTFAKAVEWIYTNIEMATSADCMLLVLFYTFEIYFDFSGYSDMAVGVSKMINIDLPINFDSPYKAISIRDFWKRWHISLTKYLTKYIYIPLGGSRKGRIFTYINTLIVFLVSGLWHGANWTFILWGLLHGIFSCLDRIFEKVESKIWKPIRWGITFLIVSILWLLFSAYSILQWETILCMIVSGRGLTVSTGILKVFEIPESHFVYSLLHLDLLHELFPYFTMALFIIVSTIVCIIPDNNYRKMNEINLGNLIIASLAFVWGVLCLGAETTFVYFGF